MYVLHHADQPALYSDLPENPKISPTVRHGRARPSRWRCSVAARPQWAFCITSVSGPMKPTKRRRTCTAAIGEVRHEHTHSKTSSATPPAPHQSLDRGDQLRAARAVGVALFHPALFWLTIYSAAGLGRGSCIPHRVRHGRDVLPALHEILAGQLFAERDWDLVAENTDVAANREENFARGRALQRRAEAVVLHPGRLPDRLVCCPAIVIWRVYFSGVLFHRRDSIRRLSHAFSRSSDLRHHHSHLCRNLGQRIVAHDARRGYARLGWKHHRAGFARSAGACTPSSPCAARPAQSAGRLPGLRRDG